MSDLEQLTATIIAQKRTQFHRILLNSTLDLNAIDPYGFTPLIESAIVNDAYFTERLLQQSVDPNRQDATGRTALHWACDNHNLDIAGLLLKYHADPNIRTASGQTALIFPLLRDQEKLKQLLYRHGAHLKFAQNFIHMKLLGHRFELQGQTHIANDKKELILIDFEGFFLEFSVAVILDSLKRFENHFVAKDLQNFFPKLKIVLRAFQNAAQLIRYQHYLINIAEHQQSIRNCLRHAPLLVPVSYRGHALSFIQYGDFFIKCDRGAHAAETGHSVVIYRMHHPEQFNQKFVVFLIYQQHTEHFIHHELNRLLGLEEIDSLAIPLQISGNCAWANIEAAIPATFYLLFLNDPNPTPKQVAKKLALDFYYAWRNWDQDRSVEFLKQAFARGDATQRAAWASAAGAVFFQSSAYQDSNSVARAEKLLPIIKQTEFRYIYEAYIHTYFSDDPKMQVYLINLLDLMQ